MRLTFVRRINGFLKFMDLRKDVYLRTSFFMEERNYF